MPWIYASLRGQKVLARADESGKLRAEEGRVEIRYKPQDGKAYRALPGNLVVDPAAKVLPDDHCAAAAAAPAPSGSKYAQEKEKKAASGARFSRENPDLVAGKSAREGEFVVFTDGACSGNPGPAGAGFVVVAPGGVIREGFQYLGTATNNVAELTAILRGVEAIADASAPARVHTDSSYSIGVLQKGWKAKANQELIAEIRAVLSERPHVRLVYVPGHAGVPLNERADELAREAVTSRKTKALDPQ